MLMTPERSIVQIAWTWSASAWALYRAWGAGARFLVRCGVAAALGLLLAAVQLLPFIEYARHSAVLAYRAGWLPPLHASLRSGVNLLMPYYYGSPTGRDDWGEWNFNEMSASVGLSLWVLLPVALVARRHDTAFFGLMTLSAGTLFYGLGGRQPRNRAPPHVCRVPRAMPRRRADAPSHPGARGRLPPGGAPGRMRHGATGAQRLLHRHRGGRALRATSRGHHRGERSSRLFGPDLVIAARASSDPFVQANWLFRPVLRGAAVRRRLADAPDRWRATLVLVGLGGLSVMAIGVVLYWTRRRRGSIS
jgi:hypothetical protein